ncbi:MAG: hypothetical protein ACNI3C_11285 [Candidatus Marinarcus sp.]|uniref:hypothetical protein n=1 Tax=Candidatus Marinarcus sp. TaxID=3100987 RepID=UPI003B0069A3
MNLEKLKDVESEFFDAYPKGFEDEKLIKIGKKFNPEKLELFAKESLKKENFSNPNLIAEAYFKTIQKSAMVSLFDKLKLRDVIKALTSYEKDMLSIELYELLYGNKKDGFEGLVEFLAEFGMAKWTLVTLVPYSINRQKEYFIKPTTTKNIIKYLEIPNLIYKPRPSYEFYQQYTKALDNIKSKVSKPLSFDNAAFTGFLKMGIEICGE